MFNKEERCLKKKIVFITSCSNSHNALPEIAISKKKMKKTYKILYSALKKFPEYKLVVKGRKGWEMNNLPKLMAGQENYEIEFIKDISPIKLLSNAEIVIIHVTTMALDALCLDKPVISIWFKDMDYFAGLEKGKGLKTVYNSKQLENAIRKCKIQTKENTMERKKYLEKELFKLDGKSSERIANFINKLIKEKRK